MIGFDERDLRRALEERSGAPAPRFRARLSMSLAAAPSGRYIARRDAAAALASALLAVLAIAVLLGPRLLPAAAPAAPHPARSEASEPAPRRPGADVSSIQFLTASVGTVVAGGALYATADGGDHWQRQLDPSWAQGAPPLDQRLTYLDQRRGLLFSAHAQLRTVDGGAHWASRPTPFPPELVRSLSFLPSGEGWALVGAQAASQCTAQPSAVWHTTDLGLTWSVATAALPEPRCKTEISFRDPHNGWVVTEGRFGPPTLLATTDGGVTWRAVVLAGPAADAGLGERRLHIPVMFDARNGVLPAAGEEGGFGYYRTADGGASWGPYHAVELAGGRTGIAYHFADASRWWLCAGPLVASTVNGGVTWTSVDVSALGVDALAEIDVVTARTAWALGTVAGRGVLMRSDDGGVHWRLVPVG